MNGTDYNKEPIEGLSDAHNRLNGWSVDRGSNPSDRQWALVLKYCFEKLNDKISAIVHSEKE